MQVYKVFYPFAFLAHYCIPPFSPPDLPQLREFLLGDFSDLEF